MKKIERVICIMLLFVISLSNVSAPLTYAAEKISSDAATTQIKSTNSLAPAPQFVQPENGSVLGTSTSLFEVGTQEGNQMSASTRVPVRMQQLPKKVYDTDENVTLAVTNPDNDPFTTSVINGRGKNANVPITETNDGTTTNVQLQSSNEIRPGKYTIKVTDEQGNVTSQDFSWGVLAMNTDKTEYHPNEKANISFGVLDDQGNMVCDAKLTLQITDTTLGVNDTLSSDNKRIQENEQCQYHDFSLQPDYSAQYQFGEAGTYTFTLTAITTNGTHTITQTIPVTDTIPFDVQRVSATRIYPLNTYPMTFNVTAHQDFSGIVTETVPQDFTITPATESANTISYDDMQTVYLNANDPGVQLSQAIAASASAGRLVMPFQGNYPITQGFGAQLTDPTLQAFYTQYGLAGHDGVDFGVPMNTPLYAVDDGTIIQAGSGDYGTTVSILHAWGQSYYGHLSTTVVTVGTHVTKGQLIGYSGESGEATGPHLHFGMKPLHPDMTNGYYGKVDPLPYLPYNNAQATMALSTLNPELATATVLAASTSAAAQPTPTLTEETASDSAFFSPQPASTTATLIATPTVQPTASATPSAQPIPTNSQNFHIQIGSSSANENFSILDKQILTSEELTNNSQTEKVKVITWHVTLKSGQSTTLGYAFKAPHVSPQFYLLGPMQFYQHGSNKVVFQEQRQWQLASDDVGVEWYSNNTGNKYNGYSWQYRKKIDLNHTKVAATQTNFPVLVSISGDTSLSSHAQGVGNDILFTDSTGENLLPFEIESYSSGTLQAWVNISSLSSTTDTIIYMYYGNPSATTLANGTGTWNSNYKAVLHMTQTTGNVSDSTSNGNAGVNSSTTSSAGQIGNARTFAGSTTSDLQITNNSTVDFGANANFTVSLWFKSTLGFTNNVYPTILAKETASGSVNGYGILESGFSSDQNFLYGEIYSGNTQFLAISNQSYNDGNWHYVAFERSGSSLTLYLDGTSIATGTGTTATLSTTANVFMGTFPSGGAGNFTGSEDEVHISNTALSSQWITTEYNNQSAPGSFFTEGSAETNIYAPTMAQIMRHGEWFSAEGQVQPFVF